MACIERIDNETKWLPQTMKPNGYHISSKDLLKEFERFRVKLLLTRITGFDQAPVLRCHIWVKWVKTNHFTNNKRNKTKIK